MMDSTTPEKVFSPIHNHPEPFCGTKIPRWTGSPRTSSPKIVKKFQSSQYSMYNRDPTSNLRWDKDNGGDGYTNKKSCRGQIRQCPANNSVYIQSKNSVLAPSAKGFKTKVMTSETGPLLMKSMDEPRGTNECRDVVKNVRSSIASYVSYSNSSGSFTSHPKWFSRSQQSVKDKTSSMDMSLCSDDVEYKTSTISENQLFAPLKFHPHPFKGTKIPRWIGYPRTSDPKIVKKFRQTKTSIYNNDPSSKLRWKNSKPEEEITEEEETRISLQPTLSIFSWRDDNSVASTQTFALSESFSKFRLTLQKSSDDVEYKTSTISENQLFAPLKFHPHPFKGTKIPRWIGYPRTSDPKIVKKFHKSKTSIYNNDPSSKLKWESSKCYHQQKKRSQVKRTLEEIPRSPASHISYTTNEISTDDDADDYVANYGPICFLKWIREEIIQLKEETQEMMSLERRIRSLIRNSNSEETF